MNGTRSLTGTRPWKSRSPSSLVAALFVLILFAGCSARRAERIPEEPGFADLIHELPESIPSPLNERCFVIGTSVDDRPIACITLGRGEEVILFIASIHGDESAGTPLLHDLAAWFRDRPQLLDGRKLLLVPEANPDGMAADRRTNSNGIDLNRNFPSDNRTNNRRYGLTPLSEPEAAAIAKMIRLHAPQRIVSLHEPVGCIDYDGPAHLLAAHMATHCDLPVGKLGTRSGSLGAWAGEDLKIPIITVELPRSAKYRNRGQLWDMYGKALIEAVLFRQPSGGVEFERPTL